ACLVPWTGVFVWAMRRASDLETLIERTRGAVEGAIDRPIADRSFHGELDELARGIDAVRELVVEQRASFAEHRGAIDQIVGALGEGLLAVSPKGKVVFANSRLTEMFGIGARAGSSVLEVVRKRSVAEAIQKALAGSPSVERVRSGAGHADRQIEIRVFPVTSSSEIAAVALFIDVSEIARLQNIRKDFLDDFSHEVRTPLAGLRSAAETLESGGLTREHEEALRQVMSRQLLRIERLVKDLSELNRVESGELVLERRPVNVHELLSDLCNEFRERFSDRPIALTSSGEDALASADPVRLQQIFSNLLDNAWKHAGGGIHVEVARTDGDAVVRISDEGDGIPPGEADRIFHRFHRVDRSRSQTVPGTGLGLAITKHLVLLHGGSIRAYNRTGGGATFEVRLPAL
ncbi:MAG: ATP-binding protein, partial [Thermoanaerobaculia bacterium]